MQGCSVGTADGRKLKVERWEVTPSGTSYALSFRRDDQLVQKSLGGTKRWREKYGY